MPGAAMARSDAAGASTPADLNSPQSPPAIVFGRALDIAGTPLRLAVRPTGGYPDFGQSTYRGPIVRPNGLPLRAASMSSSFGMRYHPLSGGLRFHAGLDLAAPTGTPVHATAPGVVSFAGWYGGYGLCVAVDHGGGTATLFGHLSATSARAGDRIEAGDILGRVGSTGQSTGPHLHYEVRRGGRPVDPRGYL